MEPGSVAPGGGAAADTIDRLPQSSLTHEPFPLHPQEGPEDPESGTGSRNTLDEESCPIMEAGREGGPV